MEPSRTAALAVRSHICARDIRCQTRVGRLSHQSQRPANLVVRDQAQERRLLKLDAQTLRSASSNTTSPVVLTKSPNTMVSASVSIDADGRERTAIKPPNAMATISPTAPRASGVRDRVG